MFYILTPMNKGVITTIWTCLRIPHVISTLCNLVKRENGRTSLKIVTCEENRVIKRAFNWMWLCQIWSLLLNAHSYQCGYSGKTIKHYNFRNAIVYFGWSDICHSAVICLHFSESTWGGTTGDMRHRTYSSELYSSDCDNAVFFVLLS